MTQLENEYAHQFTYADDLIEGIKIIPPQKGIPLEAVINDLSVQTGLKFTYLANKFIAITKRPQTNQIFCGYILDYDTKLPIPDAAVLGTSDQAISDEFGYFKLEVNSNDQLIELRHLGYNVLTIDPFEQIVSGCLNYYLKQGAEALSEIILRNYISKGIDKVSDGTFRLNFDNFGILPGLIETDVLQTVQALPGVQSATETVSDINIRGGTNDQNLILWDGIKMYQTGHFFGLISAFNPHMTRQATLIKNGTKASFTDGVSGTIIMQTDNQLDRNLKAAVGINFINADALLAIPLGKRSSLQLASRKAINDYVDTPTFTKYFDRIEQDSEIEQLVSSESTFDFYDISVRWLLKPSDQDFIKVSGILLNNELNFIGNATLNNTQFVKENGIITARNTKLG